MIVTWQLRHRPAANRRYAMFSAWAMSIAFAAIAAISFAVDQAAVSSLAGEGDFGQSLGEFNPVRLIRSLIDTVGDRVNDAR
jgi:hypothetical protein